jgi:predicted nucleic acid-binding protein
LEPKFSTCEAVVSETAHLLPKNRATLSRFRRVLEKGIVTLEPLGPLELPAIFDLMEKYADVPMSFADACLVRMIERTPGSTLFTTDTDFKLYRQHRRRLIPLIAPF